MQAERDDPPQTRRRVVVVASAAGDQGAREHERGRRQIRSRKAIEGREDVREARVRPDERIAQRSTCRHRQTSQRGADRRRLQQSS